jgi:hypothetical protein
LPQSQGGKIHWGPEVPPTPCSDRAYDNLEPFEFVSSPFQISYRTEVNLGPTLAARTPQIRGRRDSALPRAKFRFRHGGQALLDAGRICAQWQYLGAGDGLRPTRHSEQELSREAATNAMNVKKEHAAGN